MKEAPPRQRFALLALAAVIVAGCGGSGPASRDSGIEGVPIPAEARQTDDWLGFNLFIVPTMSYDELVAFYDRTMPVRRGFRDWSLCATGEEVYGDDLRLYRIYTRGSDDALAVVAASEDSLTGVLIAVGEKAREGVDEYC